MCLTAHPPHRGTSGRGSVPIYRRGEQAAPGQGGVGPDAYAPDAERTLERQYIGAPVAGRL